MIPEYVEKITVLTLTTKGKVSLAGYSAEAVAYAATQMNKKGILDPFRFFIGVCRKWSQENKHPVDFELVNRLSRHYHVVESDPALEPGTGINLPEGKATKALYPVWKAPENEYIYDSMDNTQKLKYLFAEAQNLITLKTCTGCKDTHVQCPQAKLNPYADAMLDLQKQVYSKSGYMAQPLDWHVRNRLKDVFTPVSCTKVEVIDKKISPIINDKGLDNGSAAEWEEMFD